MSRCTEVVAEQAGGNPLPSLVMKWANGVVEGPLPGPGLPFEPLSVQTHYYVTYLVQGNEVGHLVPYWGVPDCPLLRASMTPARLYVASDGQLTAELLHMPTPSHERSI